MSKIKVTSQYQKNNFVTSVNALFTGGGSISFSRYTTNNDIFALFPVHPATADCADFWNYGSQNDATFAYSFADTQFPICYSFSSIWFITSEQEQGSTDDESTDAIYPYLASPKQAWIMLFKCFIWTVHRWQTLYPTSVNSKLLDPKVVMNKCTQ